jgi:hypothetical protein
VLDVGDVVDADAAQPVLADRVWHALCARKSSRALRSSPDTNSRFL